jgi:uncharacterized protein YfdQ (DUF2303 family)
VSDQYDDENQPPEAQSAMIEGQLMHGHDGPTPEDEREKLNRVVTIIQTGVQGHFYLAAATAENGLEVEEKDYRHLLPGTRPARTLGTRVVADLDSFKNELGRKELTDESTIWANAERLQVVAIYNDHTNELTGFRDDQLQLQLVMDQEWKAWHDLSGKYLGQEDFGDAIEELLHTVILPDQADLMEVIESVRVSTGSTFESAIRRSDGQQQLSYKEESTTTAGRTREIEVPQMIRIAVAPFEGYNLKYEIDAYFRTRVVNGRLMLCIKLKPTRNVLIAAWKDLRDEITTFAERPVLNAR